MRTRDPPSSWSSAHVNDHCATELSSTLKRYYNGLISISLLQSKLATTSTNVFTQKKAAELESTYNIKIEGNDYSNFPY